MKNNPIKIIRDEIIAWFNHVLIWMPGRIGSRLRYFFYKNGFSNCGKTVFIDIGCYIRELKNIFTGHKLCLGMFCEIYASGGQGERIEIGDNVTMNSRAMINADCAGFIKIGNNVIMGPNIILRASNHRFDRRAVPVREQGHEAGRIVIGDDVWFGANVVVLPNVTIGRGAIVGAGAVVTKDVKEYTIVAGVPAKEIGVRGKGENK